VIVNNATNVSKLNNRLSLENIEVEKDDDIWHWKARTSGVSKWDGTRYFYPPEIVYSTGRNY
jgi:hypothetical protein